MLSEAVKRSGVLEVVATFIEQQTEGFSTWGVLSVFCVAVVICTTFISHTVGAMVILPVVASVGNAMLPVPHPRMLVMGNVLMCSCAMGLPVSGAYCSSVYRCMSRACAAEGVLNQRLLQCSTCFAVPCHEPAAEEGVVVCRLPQHDSELP